MTSAAVVDRGFEVIDCRWWRGWLPVGSPAVRVRFPRCIQVLAADAGFNSPASLSNFQRRRTAGVASRRAASELKLALRGRVVLPILASSAIVLGAFFH